jgi:hypothetical protein
VGDDWTPPAETKAALAKMMEQAKASGAPLPRKWPEMVVRVVQARDYNFGAASDFYDKGE